jgi:Asp-tRNA(Asn)/Glu-tRNA(Gln) amidotransferase A subunit family amidase
MHNTALENKQTKKIGMLVETPYLPVSKATKRAMSLARKALEDEGYQVVDINVDPKDYEEGRKLTIEIVCNMFAKEINRDAMISGE